MMKKLFLMIMLAAAPAFAQQTVFNVPSADVLERGKLYIELDAAFKTDRGPAQGRFSSFTPRAVLGIGGKTEIGLNLTGNIQPGKDSPILIPTLKTKFYEKKKTAIFGGSHFYIPLRNRAYKFGNYSYIAAARMIGKTRLTGGPFIASKNVFAPKAVRAGAQFGIERPINEKFSLAADWISGRHSAGYFTPGAVYKAHGKVTTYWSYSIGNGGAKAGNHFFLLEIGYNF